jgi:hypothetical protein
MKPARMQMQLHVVPRSGYPLRDLPHRFIAEVGGLQSFDEESGTDAELRKTIEYKTEAVFLSADLPQNNGFGDRSHFRITEISTDAEFGVYSYTNRDWFSITHDFQLLFISRFSPIVKFREALSVATLDRPAGPTCVARIRFANRGDTQLDTAALMVRRFLWAARAQR